MIEGMVMELYRDHVIVMTKSGEFLKLRKRGNVNIGDIYKANMYRTIPKLAYAAAAVLIFVFTSFAGYTAYANQIVGYVDIKGNKDVRLYVNRKGNVQKVDGVQNANQIKNLPVDKAVEELNTIAPDEGIYNDSSKVDISTTKIKESKLDFNKVNEKVKNILTKDNSTTEKNPGKGQPGNSLKDNKGNSLENKNNDNNGNKNNGSQDNDKGPNNDNNSNSGIKNSTAEQGKTDTDNNKYKYKDKGNNKNKYNDKKDTDTTITRILKKLKLK